MSVDPKTFEIVPGQQRNGAGCTQSEQSGSWQRMGRFADKRTDNKAGGMPLSIPNPSQAGEEVDMEQGQDHADRLTDESYTRQPTPV